MKRKAIISVVAMAALMMTSSFAFGQMDTFAASLGNANSKATATETEDTTSIQEQQDKANVALDKDDFESYDDFYTYVIRMHNTNGYSYKIIALKNEAGKYQEESHVTLKGYSGTEENIVIPKRLLGMPVRYISKGTFVNNTTAKTIKIPASVETISGGALTGCKAKLVKSAYLKKQKDGSYRAMITVISSNNGKTCKNSYRATKVTKLSTVKTITMKVGQKKKLNVVAYVSGKKKTGYVDPSILNFTDSDMVTVSNYGYIKAVRKGISTVEVTLKTAGHVPAAVSVVEIKVVK
jgi:hypothetical protein